MDDDVNAQNPKDVKTIGPGPRWLAKTMGLGRRWLAFAILNTLILGYYGYAFVGPPSPAKRSLLPGLTTHGHYQIELDCNACHSPLSDDGEHSSGNVIQDACQRCHADQLKRSNDTHPSSKFNDPTNAELLQTLDAQNCLTCHREHVPEQTVAMGLTLPTDYCWHCHQDVAQDRPSHVDMAFDSCATAGCHNYHDNRALYEKYLDDHFGEPDFIDAATLPRRGGLARSDAKPPTATSLVAGQADAPASIDQDDLSRVLPDWEQTAHALAGVNCSHCHLRVADDPVTWTDTVSMDACERCHAEQVKTFGRGKHGMRLAAGLSPMTPAMARLPMTRQSLSGGDAVDLHSGHFELTCNACHAGHRFDTQYAAVDACVGCHADSHSIAYENSSHAALWRNEREGNGPVGSGVTCATCHLPRLRDGDQVTVSHDQNEFLRPREPMAREVCAHCHGLEFSLSALADESLKATCYDRSPEHRVPGVEMAHEYFEQRRQERDRRKAARAKR